MSESDSLAAHQRTALKVGGAALVALAYQSLGEFFLPGRSSKADVSL
jgi:hypothetical protein